MAIGAYFSPPSGMTKAQYEDILSRLEKAGQGKPSGRSYHCSFGEDGHLMVFDINKACINNQISREVKMMKAHVQH